MLKIIISFVLGVFLSGTVMEIWYDVNGVGIMKSALEFIKQYMPQAVDTGLSLIP